MRKLLQIADRVTKDNFDDLWYNDKDVNKAVLKFVEMGIITRPSHTQAYWTDKGVGVYKKYMVKQDEAPKNYKDILNDFKDTIIDKVTHRGNKVYVNNKVYSYKNPIVAKAVSKKLLNFVGV